MANIVGCGADIFIGGRDLSGDSNSFTINQSVEVPEVTTFGTCTRQRKTGGTKDWSIDHAGFFNTSASKIDEAMNATLGASTGVGVYPETASTCLPGYEGTPIQADYAVTEPIDGIATLTATYSGSGKLYRGKCLANTALTGGGAPCSGWAVDGVDFGASAAYAFGVFRVMRASGLGASTVSAMLKHSNDELSWETLAEFTDVTIGNNYEYKLATGASQYISAYLGIGGTGAAASVMMFASTYN